MDDIDSFAPINVQGVGADSDGPRVLGAGDTLARNQEIDIDSENFELICHYRWANCEQERSVLCAARNKSSMTWAAFYHNMERNQSEWTNKNHPKVQRLMEFGFPKILDRAKRTRSSQTTLDELSVQALAVNDRYAVVLVRVSEDAQAICWRCLVNIEQTEWRKSDKLVVECQTASLVSNELYIVDGSLLSVYSLESAESEDGVLPRASTNLADVLGSEPAHITVVCANRYFVLVVARERGFVLYQHAAGLPLIAFVEAPIATASLQSSLICAGTGDGVLRFWQIAEVDGAPTVQELSEQQLMHNWVTERDVPVKMQPEEVWNVLVHGPRLIASSKTNFLMYERVQGSHKICVLNNLGTVAAVAKFGDLVALVNVKGEVALCEFCSGSMFLSTRSASDLIGADDEVTVGRQVLSFGPRAVTLLLPNGSLFMIKLK